MKPSFRLITLALFSFVVGSLAGAADEPSAAVAASKERIGVYDSRSIAVAFAGSPAHEAQMRRMRERHDQAKAAGDAAGMAKVEAEGQALQRRFHQQGFSTAPVDEILAQLGDAVPEIRKSAGVTLLVSKWDETELQKHPDAERVDVTPQLIDALHPTERQRRSAVEIQKHKPISLEQAAKLDD